MPIIVVGTNIPVYVVRVWMKSGELDKTRLFDMVTTYLSHMLTMSIKPGMQGLRESALKHKTFMISNLYHLIDMLIDGN